MITKLQEEKQNKKREAGNVVQTKFDSLMQLKNIEETIVLSPSIFNLREILRVTTLSCADVGKH